MVNLDLVVEKGLIPGIDFHRAVGGKILLHAEYPVQQMRFVADPTGEAVVAGPVKIIL